MITRTAEARRAQSQEFLIKEHSELCVLGVSVVSPSFRIHYAI